MNNNHETEQQTNAQGQSRPLTNGTPRRYVRPHASITETSDDFVVQVEMPGVNRQGIEITLDNGELVLVGHRKPVAVPECAELVYHESRPVDFRRIFGVDHTIDATRIRAEVEQGLLILTLPKADAAKPRRIEINSLS